jgi:hypothetical protein
LVNPISGIPGYNPDATYLPWPTNTQPTARPSTPYRQYATQTGPTAPIGSFGGGESGNNNTTQFDPYGTALGPQIGDWMNTLKSFFGNNTPAATPNTPDPITSAPSSGAVPTPVPTAQPKPATGTVSTGEESLGTLQPGGASPMSGANSVSDMYYPGFDFSNWSPSGSTVTPTVTTKEGPDLQPLPAMPTGATPDLGGQWYGDAAAQQLALKGADPTPVSKTDQIFSTGADNPYLKMGIGLAAGMVPGGNLANMAYNAYSSGDANYEAARKGVLSPDWNKGFFGNLMNPASWAGGAIGTALGKDAGYYDNAPVLSDAASATKLDPAVMSDPNAILNGAYGSQGKDTSLGDIKAQGTALGITGDNPNLFNPYNVASNNFNNGGGGITGTDGFMGMQLNPGLGGSDLYTGMGANRFFGNNMAGDMGRAGGYGESEIDKYRRMNLGNRWDG